MLKCKKCGGIIRKKHVTKKKDGGGFIANCPHCGAVNNVKCRCQTGKVRSVKITKYIAL